MRRVAGGLIPRSVVNMVNHMIGTHRRLASIGVLAATLVACPSPQAAQRDASGAAAGRIRCLRPVEPGPFAAENVLAAARRVLRRRTLTNQSGTIHLTPGTYVVDKLLPLSGNARDADRTHYRKLMLRRCGERTASSTWLVLIQLSQAQLVLPDSVFLFTRTANGWRVAFDR